MIEDTPVMILVFLKLKTWVAHGSSSTSTLTLIIFYFDSIGPIVLLSMLQKGNMHFLGTIIVPFLFANNR